MIQAEDAALIPSTDVQTRINTMLANRAHIVEKLKPILIEGVDVYSLPGMNKPSLGKPGAEKLAAIFGLNGKFEVDKETMEAIGATANGKPYIAFVCNLMANGRVKGQGRGATVIEWERNNYRMVFEQEFNSIKDTLKEGEWKGPLQGVSKSSGKPYTYWKVKDAPVMDPLALNKAIKMAQKSAFVDAVIRATGMSDLFTQDLEDMSKDDLPQNHAHDEPRRHQEAPDYTVINGAGGMGDINPLKNAHSVVNADGTVDDAFSEPVVKCGKCGSDMKRRNGARGPFLGCANYPNCKNIQSV